MTLGEWLRQHRKDKGLTQTQVAERAGVSFSYVSTLEREQTHSLTDKTVRPRRETVIALAKAVGGDVAEALELAGFSTSDKSMQIEDALTSRVKGLIKDLTLDEQAEMTDEVFSMMDYARAKVLAKRDKGKQ